MIQKLYLKNYIFPLKYLLHFTLKVTIKTNPYDKDKNKN